MMKRTLPGTCIAALITIADVAAYLPETRAQTFHKCNMDVAAVEAFFNQSVEIQALNDKDVDEVNLLLDEADQACSQGKNRKAIGKLKAARRIIATSIEGKVK